MKEIVLDKKSPLVSITVPTYSGKFLQGTLNSLVNQSFKDIEVIVVSDGGGENIDKIIELFSFFRGLRFIKKENGGTGSAINAGHAASKGKYLTWCSADNIYFPSFVENLVVALGELEKQSAPVELVYSDFVFMNEQGRVLNEIKHTKPQSSEDLIDGYDVGMSFMYTADLWRKTGPYWKRICEDYNWVVRAAQHTNFGLVQTSLAAFRVHGGQITGSRKTEEKKAADDCKALARHLFQDAPEPPNKEDFELAPIYREDDAD